jgi:hypothetical protein
MNRADLTMAKWLETDGQVTVLALKGGGISPKKIPPGTLTKKQTSLTIFS